MVNRGEEKVRVHMNVVPRSTGNTNSGIAEESVYTHILRVLSKKLKLTITQKSILPQKNNDLLFFFL